VAAESGGSAADRFLAMPVGHPWRGGCELDNFGRERRSPLYWPALVWAALICVPGVQPGVRWAGLPRLTPALTPGQRHRRRRLDSKYGSFRQRSAVSAVCCRVGQGAAVVRVVGQWSGLRQRRLSSGLAGIRGCSRCWS